MICTGSPSRYRYAKLQTGVDSSTLFGQGLLYLLEAFSADPVTPLIAVSASAMMLWLWAPSRLAHAPGCLLYIGYIVRVGGDPSRDLTVPLLAVVVWARIPWRLRATDVSGALAASRCLDYLRRRVHQSRAEATRHS